MGRGGGAKERMRGEEGERIGEEKRGEEEGGSKGGCNEQGAAGNRVGGAHGERDAKGIEKQKNMRSLIGDQAISRVIKLESNTSQKLERSCLL